MKYTYAEDKFNFLGLTVGLLVLFLMITFGIFFIERRMKNKFT
ncbi:hypothetical protein [Metabacillus schmidteae]|nr:hypothetical protein [Metabacillus schmidteae]